MAGTDTGPSLTHRRLRETCARGLESVERIRKFDALERRRPTQDTEGPERPSPSESVYGMAKTSTRAAHNPASVCVRASSKASVSLCQRITIGCSTSGGGPTTSR